MQVVSTINELKERIFQLKAGGAKIGFVPTMGALHAGHISLVRESTRNNPVTVVSIYVNPTQFNDKNDLKNYPRNLDSDIKLLEQTDCDIVFAPDNDEMYPQEDTRKFEFGTMGDVMEGKHRPGHFNGVAQIVSKFFDVVDPDRSYFGKKDFQQLAIIRQLVAKYNYPVEIIGCPIIREDDGLAMSSRNKLLNDKQRKVAPLIYATLKEVKNRLGTESLESISNFVSASINSEAGLQLEYFQVVDTNTLVPVHETELNKALTACIAVHAGRVRLIDNIDLIS